MSAELIPGKLYRVNTSVGVLINGRYIPVDSVFMLLSIKPYCKSVNVIYILQIYILHNGKNIMGVVGTDFGKLVEKI